MRNYIQEGKNLTVDAPTGGIESGGIYANSGLVGFAVHKAAAGDPVTITTEGVFDAEKRSDAAEAFAVGDVLYIDADGNAGADGPAFSKVAGGNGQPCAVAVAAATATSAECRVKLAGVRV